jgi:hypothetical protein
MNKNDINIKLNVGMRNVPLKVSENEIYIIKENNIKRIHDILKNSYTAKPNLECNVKIIISKIIANAIFHLDYTRRRFRNE